MNNLIIRKLIESDIPVVLPMLQEMYLQHDLAEPDLFAPNTFSIEKIKKYLKESINSEVSTCFIAEIDSKIAGTIRVELKETPCFYKEKHAGYLDDLVVAKDYRRKGVGKALIHKALEFLKSKDIHLVEAKIYEFNEASRKLTEDIGFKKTFSYFYKQV